MIFGMDGDLFMLLLGLNRPECYIMRRWQGIAVNDFEEPAYSKIDPWGVGMVYVDIQYIREGLVYEFLRQYIDDEEKFHDLVDYYLSPTQLVSEYNKMYQECLEQQQIG